MKIILLALCVCFTNSVSDREQLVTELVSRGNLYPEMSIECRRDQVRNRCNLWIQAQIGNGHVLHFNFARIDVNPNELDNLGWWSYLSTLRINSDAGIFANTDLYLKKSGYENLITVVIPRDDRSDMQLEPHGALNQLYFYIDYKNILDVMGFIHLNKEQLNQVISTYVPKIFRPADEAIYETIPVHLAHPFYELTSNPSDELLARINKLVTSMAQVKPVRLFGQYIVSNPARLVIADLLYGHSMLSNPQVVDYQNQGNWDTLDRFAKKLLNIPMSNDAPST